jgi:hypothetical protein
MTKKLLYKELHDLYFSANSIKAITGHVSTMEEKRREDNFGRKTWMTEFE